MPAEIQNQKVRGGPVKTSEKGISTTPKRQNYLKYIYLEEQEHGPAWACRINEQLGVTRSTVALTFRELRAEGFITYEPYSPIRLTDKGRAIAEAIVRRYSAVKHFSRTVLELDEAMSEKIACELEHVISDAIAERLLEVAKVHAERTSDATASERG